MAKKKAAADPVNVSELIRNTWDEDQSAKPAAVVAKLKSRGVPTNPGTVATTLSAYRKKLGMAPLRGKRKGKRAKKTTAAMSNGTGQAQMGTGFDNGRSITSVIEALKFVTKAKELVGVDGIREILKAI